MESQIEEQKYCAYSKCGRSFGGRADKIYCGDQCRNAAGREKKKREKWEEPEHFGQTNRILMRNYQILKSLFNEKGRPVSNWRLRDEGFEFRFMTSIYETEDGMRLNMCYDYGWQQLPGNEIRIYPVPPLMVLGIAKATKHQK
ncbi:hypothetical protein ACTJKN_07345 [Pedobacter sp. 22163]|uniref:hypothetical protein n=1 Tax=Pedobacter sp. 22163 TaxID=3453883 RepID=UPI003F8427D8